MLWLISLLGILLSIWIIIPAPTMRLLPLGVVAPEISPILALLNAIALILGIAQNHPSKWLALVALFISLLPLIQFYPTNQRFKTEIVRVIGTKYFSKIPQPSPLDIHIEREIEFANPQGVKLTINLYRPQSEGNHPTVIMIYGGAWRSGKPSNNEIFSRYLAKRGYAVIALDYRHAPVNNFPTQLEDIQLALSYIANNSDQLKVDLNRVAIMGRSAGGHLATLTTLQTSPIVFRALINYYGPVNLTQAYFHPPIPDPINTRQVLLDFLGETPDDIPELYQQASPISYLERPFIPTLFAYAGRDHLVKTSYGQELYQELKKRDNQVIWLEVPWAEHSFDEVFWGLSNRLILHYTEVFLAWAIYK